MTITHIIKPYYALSKPGIIYGNCFITFCAYIYASHDHRSLQTSIGLLLGTAAIIACGCVINNYFDRFMDQNMQRTKSRALATRTIPVRNALIYAMCCGIFGTAILAVTTNVVTTYLGIIGLVMYAGVYTYAKPRTKHATLIGTIPGAIPPLAGYAAATGGIDIAGILLGIFLILWQMIHFYAIAIFRRDDYAHANIPLMSVVSGVTMTRIHMICYAVLLTMCCVALGYTDTVPLAGSAVLTLISSWWLIHIIWFNKNTSTWARANFGRSLLVLTCFGITLLITGILQ